MHEGGRGGGASYQIPDFKKWGGVFLTKNLVTFKREDGDKGEKL